MALIIEDGTIVENANSYVDTDDIGTYHTLMGNAEWAAAAEADQEPAVLRAMAWMETRPWKGYKTSYDNPLSWPRAYCYTREGYLVPDDEIPEQIIKALCEASLIEIVSPGALRPALERGGQIRSVSVHGAVSVTYDGNAPATTQYATVMSLIGQFVIGGNIFRIERA